MKQSNGKTNNKKKNNVKLVECGICGEKHKRSEMCHDEGSDTGYLCPSCYSCVHVDYFIEEF